MSSVNSIAYPFVGPLSGGLGWLANWTGDTSFDTVGDTVSLASTNRGNKVSQEFQKKLSAIDYQIQRQELHRQDIRDLVEVTTGRMDVFLLSGTLLLTFCLGWFSQSRIMESELPTWFENLFLISNFNAVGYLLLCVWLAMHASIASHSLGVRLLVNYQRLSIPTDKQLRQIYVPFFPQNKMQRLVNVGQRLGFIPEDEEEVEDPDEITHHENESHSWPLQMGADDTHFRRFLQAQSKWLAYDAYARVCLTLGMNQMLHALSYYIVGELGKSGCVAGTVFTFFGVKGLSLAVMKLDVSDGTATSSEKTIATVKAVAGTILPSLIAAVLLFVPLPFGDEYKSMWAIPCFLLHWWFNRLMRFNITPVEPEGGGLKLPRMFRAVGYLSIIEFTQRRIAHATRTNEALINVSNLLTMRDAMEKKMCDTAEKDRRTADITDLQKKMRDLLGVISMQTEFCPSAESELQVARQTMDRFALWQQAPEILLMLQSLRDQEGKDEEKQAIEKWYGNFLDQCRELDLIEVPEDLHSFTTRSARSSAGMSSNSLLPSGLNLQSAPEPRRNVQASLTPDNRSVEEVARALDGWNAGVERANGPENGESFEIEALESNQHGFLATPLTNITEVVEKSTRAAFEHLTPHHTSHNPYSSEATNLGDRSPRTALMANRGNETTRSRVAFAPDVEHHSNRNGHSNHHDNRSNRSHFSPHEHLPHRTTSQMSHASHGSHEHIHDQVVSGPSRLHSSAKFEFFSPKEATPPDDLPTELVLGFNGAIGVWWLLAACVHIYRSWELILIAQAPTNHAHVTSRVRLLESTWPEPASLFQVSSLHCDSSQVIVNNRFSTFSSQRHPNGTLGLPKKFANVQIPAIHCDHEGCDALTQISHNKSWLLSPLPHSRGSVRSSVMLPGNHTWHKASVARTPCSDGTCDAVRIAGWDGSKVIIADFRKKGLTDKWEALRSFFVRPGLGKCRAPERDCPSRSAQYTNVRALQLGTGGRTLLVLLEDGFLDGWDLSEGVLRGRWQHNSHTAMCHDGEQLFLARQSSEGPIIEVAPLPSLLEDEYKPEDIPTGCDTPGCHPNFLTRTSL